MPKRKIAIISIVGLWLTLVTHGVALPTDTEQEQPQEDMPSMTTQHPNATVDDFSDSMQVASDPRNDTKRYLVIDDMIIKKDQNRAGLVNNAWPFGIVPYVYHISIGPQQRVQISQAMANISSATCIKFRDARNEDSYSLLFMSDPRSQGCSSYVGFQNKKQQPIQLAAVCSGGNVVHEIIHALGFFHEQTRNDRDDYVRINFENIQPGYESNFKREMDMDPPPESETYGVPYNYDSIMHYGKMFFSKNKEPTIVPLNNPNATGTGDNIGQREGMSWGDVQMINTKYKCPTTTHETVGPNIPPEEDHEEQSTTPSAPSTTTKPGSNPMCQINPSLPYCK